MVHGKIFIDRDKEKSSNITWHNQEHDANFFKIINGSSGPCSLAEYRWTVRHKAGKKKFGGWVKGTLIFYLSLVLLTWLSASRLFLKGYVLIISSSSKRCSIYFLFNLDENGSRQKDIGERDTNWNSAGRDWTSPPGIVSFFPFTHVVSSS